MRAETKAGLLLVGKSILVLLGAILVAAAWVDLAVEGFSVQAAGYLLVGLLFAGGPLALAFRDAARHARGAGAEAGGARVEDRGPRGGP